MQYIATQFVLSLPYLWGIIAGMPLFFLMSRFFSRVVESYILRRVWKEKVIVPEYDPPDGLYPIEAAVVVGVKSRSAIWPATLVDLKYRGYIDFAPCENVLPQDFKIIPLINLLCFLLIAGLLAALHAPSGLVYASLAGVPFYVVLFCASEFSNGNRTLRSIWCSIPHVLSLAVAKQNAPALKPFEQKFLHELFGAETKISTRELSGQRLLRFNNTLTHIEDDLSATLIIGQVSETMNALSKDMRLLLGRNNNATLPVLLFGAISAVPCFVLALSSESLDISDPMLISIITFLIILGLAVARSSSSWYESGFAVANAKWRGFILFLFVTERDRVQGLNADHFERLLPYAMIFGIEKHWKNRLAVINRHSSLYLGQSREDGQLLITFDDWNELLLCLLGIVFAVLAVALFY